MTLSAWAIYHPAQGVLLHSVHKNERGAWAMLYMHSRPEEQRADVQSEALGFRAIPIKVKYEIGEVEP